MKKQLSKRIGAILTMTAMLVTLLPMAIPVMATGETSGNLITNGDFADGNMNGWENADVSVAIYNDAENDYGLTLPAIKVTKRNITVGEQVITNLTDEASYKLSLTMVNAGKKKNASIRVTVQFGNSDETTGEFVPLDGDDAMKGALCGIGSNGEVMSATQLRMSADATDVKCRREMTFNLPNGADAVKVSLYSQSGASSGNNLLLDDIVLETCSENIQMINNGEFLTLSDNTLQGWTVNSSSAATYGVGDTTKAINSYAKLTGTSASLRYIKQQFTLRYGKIYELNFDFVHTGFEGDKAPDASIEISNINGISQVLDIKATCTNTPASTDSNNPLEGGKSYKAYIVLDKPTENYSFDLVSAIMYLNKNDVDTWPEGAAVYYDNISLVEIGEIDEADKMAFAVGENGEFTTTPADAKAASCIFVQGETPTIQKFIVAKYNSTTHSLEKATLVNAGEGIAAGNAKRYDVELDDYNSASYYRIFLWDGITLKPVLDSEEIGR